jgi:hypothetical protein
MSAFIPTTLFKMHGPEPDEYDHGMVDTLLRGWNSHFHHSPNHPRVGDYVIMPDGTYERAAYVWPECVQTAPGGSYYLGNGSASMSGTLNPGIANERIKPTDETKEGHFWTFHHNDPCADNGIGISCSCRVFKVI